MQHAETELLQMKKEVIFKALHLISWGFLFLTKFKGELEYPPLQSKCPPKSDILGILGFLANKGCDCLYETLPCGQLKSTYAWVLQLSSFSTYSLALQQF